MSIVISVQYKGITVEKAIATVGDIQLNSTHDTMTFVLNYFAQGNSEPFNSNIFSCEYKPSSGDIVSQAYAYIKTLDEFSSSPAA